MQILRASSAKDTIRGAFFESAHIVTHPRSFMLVSTYALDRPFISPKGLADPTDTAQRALILGRAHETCTEGFDQFMTKLATYFAERPSSIIRGGGVAVTKRHQIESISLQMLHLLSEMLKTSSFGCFAEPLHVSVVKL